MKELRYLKFEHSFLYKLTEGINNLINLETLILNQFSGNTITPSLFQLYNLKSLTIERICRCECFSLLVFDGLKQLNNLEVLKLSQPNLYHNLDKKIFDLINLKELVLKGYTITDIKLLSKLVALKRITIYDLDFSAYDSLDLYALGNLDEIFIYCEKVNDAMMKLKDIIQNINDNRLSEGNFIKIKLQIMSW